MTLIEMLVYIVLIIVMLISIHAIFIASLFTSRVTAASQDLQSAAQAAMGKLTSELSQSRAYTTSTTNYHVLYDTSASPSVGVIFISAYPLKTSAIDTNLFQFDASGVPSWQKWVCYYFDAKTIGSTTYGLLRRQELALSNATTTPPSAASITVNSFGTWSTAPLVAFFGASNTTTVTNNLNDVRGLQMTSLNLYPTGFSSQTHTTTQSNFTVTMSFGETVNASSNNTQDNQFTLTEQVYCRN